jgi:hypothetical protein
VRRRGDNEIVIHERVIQSGGGGGHMVYPTLTSTNYIVWALVMKINLHAQGLWEAVSGMGEPADREDMAALSALLRAVPPELVPILAVKDTSAGAWEAIKLMKMGVSCARNATAQRLRREFEALTFKDGETLDNFAIRATNVANNLRSLGDKVEEVKIVEKILNAVPSQYSQISCLIETLLDLEDLSVEELIGRLSAAEKRCTGGTSEGAGPKLLLTEEEWIARGKKYKEQGSSTGGVSGKKCRGKPQNGKGNGDRDMS